MVGYGFHDDAVNDRLKKSFEKNNALQVMVIDSDETPEFRERVSKTFGDDNRVKIVTKTIDGALEDGCVTKFFG